MADGAGHPVVAFFDTGTNSVRLLVVRLNPNGSYTILTRQKEIVRLGEGEFEQDILLPASIDRAVIVCRKFVELSRSFGADEIVAYATSAAREAKNRRLLLNRLHDEAGLEVRVISGREEARLIYLGVSSGVDLGQQTAMFIDIGGGSTEISVGDSERYHLLESLKLGAIRLTNQMVRPGEGGVVLPANYAEICDYIRKEGVYAIERLKEQKPDLYFGSSGTIQTLATISRNLFNCAGNNGMFPVIRACDLKKTIRHLIALPLERRKKVSGMVPERADIIIGGAAILDTLMGELGIQEILVSNRSLHDGMLIDHLSRKEGFPQAEPIPVRRRSVIQLGRSCVIDEPHALTVMRLALELFDSGVDAGLHSYGEEEREMLGHAAFLHDIGSFISFRSHQLHSSYIIKNADLLGFDQREIAILALIARYHRKKTPGKKDSLYGAFDAGTRRLIRTLAAFLRFAEHLDRSHAGFVRHARFRKADKNTIMLEIESERDCTLEIWAVQSDAEAFRRTFGRALEIACIHIADTGEEPAVPAED